MMVEVEVVAGGSALVVIGGLSTRYLACGRGDGRAAVWAWRITLFWLLALLACVGLMTVTVLLNLNSIALAALIAALLIPVLIPLIVGAGVCSAWLQLTRPDAPSTAGSGPGLTPS